LHHRTYVQVFGENLNVHQIDNTKDPLASTRRAIVMTAAEIGKSMEVTK